MRVSIVGVEPLGCRHAYGRVYHCSWRVTVSYSGLRPGSQICLGDDCVTVDSESGTTTITYTTFVLAGGRAGGRVQEWLEVRPPDYSERLRRLLLQGYTGTQVLSNPYLRSQLGAARRLVTLELPVQETQPLPRGLSVELLKLEVRGSSVYATLRICGDKAGYLVLSDYCYRSGGVQWCTRDSGFGAYGALVGRVRLARPGCVTVTVRAGGAKLFGKTAAVWGTITVLGPTGEIARIPFRATVAGGKPQTTTTQQSGQESRQTSRGGAAGGTTTSTTAPVARKIVKRSEKRPRPPSPPPRRRLVLPQPQEPVQARAATAATTASAQHRGAVGRPIRLSRLTPHKLLAIH